MLTLLLLFQLNYAAEALKERLDELAQERARLATTQRELKTDYTETLRFLDDAIVSLEVARMKLDARDDAEALEALDERTAQFVRQREELLAHKASVDPRNLLAEITELDRQIAALESSLRKLQR